jgi:hypothetical protein
MGERVEAIRVRVVIPHFFREGAREEEGGYGSGRRGNRLARSVALARCLGSVLSLNRSPQDFILNIAEQQLEISGMGTSPPLRQIQVDVHVFVHGSDTLAEVLALYADRITLHPQTLADPRELPLQAVQAALQMGEPSDLLLYLEDDLVIQDRQYVDKQAWFLQRTEHRYVLMPHRVEYCLSNAPRRLFVDGPIKHRRDGRQVWACDEPVVGSGQYQGQEVQFMQPSNPHSGSFCLSAVQMAVVKGGPWPPALFVGPLETAATGVVMAHFLVLKPSWTCRDFLVLEHGNPSFLALMGQWRLRGN